MSALSIGLDPVLITGFWLGVRHATEPDHVVAVTTMATQAPNRASAGRLGLLWGLGHSSSVVLLGLAILALGRGPSPSVSRVFEGTAGASLLLLAWLGARAGVSMTPKVGRARDGARRSFVVGIVHGLAGSTAVSLVLLTSIASRRTAVAYILVFVAGTTLAMGALSGLLARGLVAAPERRTQPARLRWVRLVRLGSAMASLCVGVTLLARSIGAL